MTVLMRAMGCGTNQEIIDLFGDEDFLQATFKKDGGQSVEDGLIEIYRRLRPGEPPTVESARMLIDSLFFDPRRYDLARVGRYKFNKKMALYPRAVGHRLALPAVDPMTGEILAEAGELLSRERVLELDRRGVLVLTLRVEDRNVRVFSNGMVDLRSFVDFDPEELGIRERVRFLVLRKLMEQYSGAALKEAIAENIDLLIPKHIIVDDIFASVNYLNGLAYGIGEPDDIDHLGNRRMRSVGELLQNQFRIGFSRMERVIRERMTLQDLDIVAPQSLINIRPVTAAIKEFFGSSPLS
jgi:DNA-directed RNA polymerase subunit beta